MVLIDTCGWIESFVKGPLTRVFSPYLQCVEDVLVPTIVQCELYRWARRERGDHYAAEVVSFLNSSKVIVLDTELAMLAGEVSAQYRLALADSIILATALKHKARLVTCDAHFESISGVEFHRK
jgi:predicted nucleic acid-binding protein